MTARSRRSLQPVMKRSLVLVVSVIAVLGLTAAADPATVAPQVADEGYFIERGADATDDVVGRAVSDARSAGSRFFVVVLVEEPASGATFYADSILDRLPGQEGTVLVVAPETVGWAQNLDIWTTDQLDRALDASLDGDTSDDVVTIFVGELVEPASSAGGNGGWVLLVIVVGIGAAVAFAVWRASRASRRREASQLADLKARARAQVDAVANDILDDEDEIAEAANPSATEHFEAATATYAEAAERLDRASSAREVIEVSADLDEAIWHLDAAEALLDGRPVPDRPQRPTIPAPTPTPTPTPPARSADQQGPGGTAPLPTYHRRSSRRSGFGADDMLKTVIAMQAMRSLSGGGRRSSSRSSRSSGSRSRSSGRSRGGGRRRG